eukprot:CAMPEP_0175155696 /NCGR_PEP_ID=MMETSP0087-20121206/21145_1 /TAXON_ID=136419 /ORGANISM="Unknown Unknown, Strain D1" /LENGTH=322 /DNA_ID=CAMNT_0016442933 /DNA_START=69 /DNA_END=1037 /DNA_ORIENTATION=+
MALQLTKKLVAEAGINTSLDSAGVRVQNAGSPSPPQAIEVIKTYGCDLSAHGSKPVNNELVEWADAIWAMTQSHLDILLAEFPASKAKAERLNVDEDIADPWAQPVEVYRTTCNQIEKAIRHRIAQSSSSKQEEKQQQWTRLKLNTSNKGKLAEFNEYFGKAGIVVESTSVDLKEIDGTPLQVIAHKATQMGDGVLVEDTSLDVEGADVGVNVRWLLEQLMVKNSAFVGRGVSWVVLLGVRDGKKVYVYKGEVKGKLVAPTGTEGFGFDPVVVPDGNDGKTLAESKGAHVNARAKAIQAMIANSVFATEDIIENWTGAWQHD